MTPLYLTRIELVEFRTFAKLDIGLAAEPGILIVHGSNGLGKSSLFDALEWSLTGDIDHFRATEGYKKFGSYLCRYGKRLGPTSSALTFSDGNRVERQLASVKSTVSTLKSTVENITEFLRKPDWDQPISALNRYLLLTHFLGQSTLSRLTHRKGVDRFDILKEASQSADLQKFGNALHGPGTTLPARAFVNRAAELKEDADELRSLIDQEAETWVGAEVSGAMDDTAAAILVGDIAATTKSAWPFVAREPLPADWATMSDAGALQIAIDQCEEQARARDFAINEARRLLAQVQQHQTTLAGVGGAADAADRELSAATLAVSDARAELAQKQSDLDEALASLTAARESHGQYMNLRQTLQAMESAQETREATARTLDDAGSALAKADTELARRQRLVQIENRIRGEIESLDKTLTSITEARDGGRQWLTRADVIGALMEELTIVETDNPTLGDDLATAERLLKEAQASEADSKRLLELVQSSVEALSVAVSSVAAHLPDDMNQCPVCATGFGDAAELHARANAAAERLAPVVAVQQSVHVRAQAALATALSSHTLLVATRSRLVSLNGQLASERGANSRLLERLGWDPASTRQMIDARLADLDSELQRTETQRGRRARWLGRFAGRQTSPFSEATRLRDDAGRARAVAARQLEDATNDELLAAAGFRARATQLFPDEPDISHQQVDAAIDDASAKHDQAQAVFEAASRALTEQELRIGSLQQAEAGLRFAIARATAARSAAETALAELPAQWRALGWADEDIVPVNIEAAAAGLNRATQFLASAKASLERLRLGREAWARQSAHRGAFERLFAQVDLAPNSTREQIRTAVSQKLEAIEAELGATITSKEIASSASVEIAEAVDQFNADYIKPLDELTKRINRAILCDDRIAINLRVGKRQIKQSAALEGQLPNSLNVDPGLIHSEGQMAALAVSMLCGASLTYPWSRWRALVFDDPLQHNDAIHASAFADLIANLVEAKDYQVLLSTHDLGQAEFLRRKFDARGLPCASLNLLGLGKAGVEWEFLSSRGIGTEAAVASA
ncbi:AAA family ATPase [Mesorhizobium sp. B2-1-8]|uniref:AAA family ATPase n=1 Tax=Mesorhizobium sp. B2-1-8 TaxID=2589967 RepID=UPI0015E35650|nr:AAA family ATPase [Mesorhizobium sp. B2-1-8]UCI17884.1 AAA family ATPase [Mesorhizobium sp. B2-1-8]